MRTLESLSGGCDIRATASSKAEVRGDPGGDVIGMRLSEALLLRVARRLLTIDPQMARDLYLEAFGAALSPEGTDSPRRVALVAQAASAAPAAPDPRRPVDQLLDGLVKRFTSGYEASLTEMRGVLYAFGHAESSSSHRRWHWLVFRIATDLWEDQIAVETIPLLGRQDSGPESVLMESDLMRALLANGAGRYERALAASRRACERQELGLYGAALNELVVSATRTLQNGIAADALDRLSERTQASGTEWALGVEARCRALVCDSPDAETYYTEAIDHLQRTRVDLELARAHLVYGEWLRRRNRRVAARVQLRKALGFFESRDAHEFAGRARRELLATGETALKRKAAPHNFALTPQEEQIARLAGSRLTNSEIATQLFLSPRTVEWHLRKVFMKLGVNSRRELLAAQGDFRVEASLGAEIAKLDNITPAHGDHHSEDQMRMIER